MVWFQKDKKCQHKWIDTKPQEILVVEGKVRVVKVCSKCNEIAHFPVLSIKNLREIERGGE